MGRLSDQMRVDPEFRKLIRQMIQEDDLLDSDRQATLQVARLLRGRGGKKNRILGL